MIVFDMKTALVNYIAANLIGFLLMFFVVLKNRKNSKRLLGFLYFFGLSATGALLVLFRSSLPVFISIVFANTLLITAKLFLYISLMKFYRQKPAIGYFIALIAVAFAGFLLCTYLGNNPSTRVFIIAIVSVAIHGAAFLRIYQAIKPGEAGRDVFFIANVYYFIYNIIRIIVLFITNESYGSYFEYHYDALLVLLNGVFVLVLLAGVFHMLGKEADEQVKKMNEKARFFADVYAYSPVPIMIVDNLDKIMYANEAACKMIGSTEDELLNEKWIDLLSDEDEKAHAYYCIGMLQSRHNCSTNEVIVKGAEGSVIHAEIVIESRIGGIARSGHYMIFIHDLTSINEERALAEEARRSRQSLLDNIPGFAYRCKYDDYWTMEMLSDSFKHFTGYDRKEVVDNAKISFNEIIIPEHRSIVKKQWELYIAEKKPYVGEYKIRKKDGTEAWVWEHGQAITDKNGKIAALEGFIADISERKKFEEETRLFKTISDNAVHGNAILDLNKNIVYINDYFAKVHGYEPDSLIGESIFVLISKEYKNKIDTNSIELMKRGYLDVHEAWHEKKDGSTFPMMVSVVVIKNSEGSPQYIALSAIDISEQRQLKEENILLEKHLRNQQRLETIGLLAGGVAHEINNPINGIMNYSQLILDTSKQNEEAQDYAGQIMRETKRVMMIIRNMLRFSRHQDAGHSLVNVDEIVEQALSLARTIIKNDHIEISVNIEKDIPAIECNDQQIQQILMNLITNSRDALNQKYSGHDDNKKIIISCSKIEIENKSFIRMTVEDKGMGIPESVHDSVFKPFFTTKGKQEGTGLGLSISRNIAKEHKGELSFETVEGEYTRFHLDLPLD